MTIKTGNRPMQMHLTALCLLLAIAQPGIASDSHNDNQQTHYPAQESSDLAQQDHASEGEATTISAAMAARNGISSKIAGPGKIERHLQVYGRLELPPDQRVALRARFAGEPRADRPGRAIRDHDPARVLVHAHERPLGRHGAAEHHASAQSPGRPLVSVACMGLVV